MTTQANLELVQQFYGHIGAGNIEGVLGCVADDIDIINPLPDHIPFGGTYKGKDGLLAYLGALGESIEMGLEIDKFLSDGDTVVVIGVESSSTRATDTAYRMPYVHVLTVTDGKITRFDEYNQYKEMAEAFTR